MKYYLTGTTGREAVTIWEEVWALSEVAATPELV